MALHPPSELRKTFRISIIDAIFAAAFGALAVPGSAFMTKLLMELGAGKMAFSLYSAIGPVCSIFLPVGVAITKKMTARKSVVVWMTLVSRAMMIPLGIIPFIVEPDVALELILLLLFISTLLATVASNAWTGWIADNVPGRVRGRFFSVRSQYSMIIGFIVGLLFSVFADLYTDNAGPVANWIKLHMFSQGTFDNSDLFWVLLKIFAAGGIIGVAGCIVLYFQPESPKKAEHEPYLRMLVTPMRDKNFRRLLLYAIWWMLATGIGAQFWGPYMLDTLDMSLTEMQLYGMISTTSAVLAVRLWGKMIDMYGNKASMAFAIVLGGINPIIWVFASGPSTRWVVFFEAATSGFMWSGASLIWMNFVLSIAPDEKKQMFAGVFGAFAGVASMTSVLVSGYYMPIENLHFLGLDLKPEQVLFGLGGVVRWTALIPLSFVHEPTSKSVFHVITRMQQAATQHIVNIISMVRGKNGDNGKRQ
ncbi:MAG: MFS transporter [Candidatus Brocadiia bacterium]